MKKHTFISLIIILVVASASLWTVAPAAASTSTCGQWDLVPLLSNTYIYQQNEWNSTLPQCATAGDNAQFTVTKANFANGGGSPATYPSLYKGCHPFGGVTPNQGVCTSNSNMPIKLSNISGATTSVSGSGSSSIYDFAYDIWFTTGGSPQGRPDGGTEMMIWLNHAGSIQPFGSQIGTATLGGTSWNVWAGNQGWDTISYVRQSTTNSVSGLNLQPFFSDAVSRGYLSNSDYLMDIEMGFEVWSGGQGVGINSFSASVSGSACTTCTGPTITPVPTIGPSPTPAPAGNGTGLLGQYYDNMDFTNPMVSRIDPTVNFDWGSNSPDVSIAPDTFSARWTGQVQSRFTGPVTFYTSSDDGSRVWVNNTLVVDNFTDHATTEVGGNINLVAGQKYNITVEYYDNASLANMALSWSSPAQAKQIIPQNQLYPPAGVATTTSASATAKPSNTPTGPTATRTPTQPVGASNTPTGPTATRTPTPSNSSGSACSPVNATITAPFSHDGSGTFCWKSNNLGSYINSWNLARLTVNGVDFTNKYTFTSCSSSPCLPSKMSDGYWYIYYVDTSGYGHFEAK